MPTSKLANTLKENNKESKSIFTMRKSITTGKGNVVMKYGKKMIYLSEGR